MSARRGSFRKLLPLMILVAVILYLQFDHHKSSNVKGDSTSNSGLPSATAPPDSLTLITQPGDSASHVVAMIDSAKKSVDLVMYELQDSNVEQALASAHQRGVQVRVLLNGGYYGKPGKHQPNKPAYDYLTAHGVPVHWTPSYFALTHQKTLVVDGTTGLIMTYNLQPQYYATSRDFGVVDKDKNDVTAIESAFTDDWNNRETTAPNGDELLWSPGSESATISLINQAKSSVKIYNEEMADSRVVQALGDAALRGVKVEIVMTDQKSWHRNFTTLAADGAHIRTFHGETPLYIHAKMILIDDNKLFLGSENFSLTSLQRNRELGLVTTDKSLITKLQSIFDDDYQTATPYQ